jgi:hypothetical protein
MSGKAMKTSDKKGYEMRRTWMTISAEKSQEMK